MVFYVLDTTTASAIIKGRPTVAERVEQLGVGGWCISAVTRAEMQFGLRRNPEATQLARLVEAFLAAAPTEAWGNDAADAFARAKAALAARGEGIGTADEMIAGHALALGAVLVTDNVRHFGRVPGLVVENWMRAS